jgi:antitoxin VapB
MSDELIRESRLQGAKMSLNIKNQQTYELVKELAVLKGLSLTTAVTIAVRNEIDREKAARDAGSQPGKKSRSELLMEFSKQCAPLFKDGRTGNELINALYDEETGLPK